MPVSVLSIYYIERRNESHLLPDLSYIRDIIYFLLANELLHSFPQLNPGENNPLPEYEDTKT